MRLLTSLLPLISTGLGAALLVLWIVSVLWVVQDIKQRSKGGLLTLLSILFAVVFPVAGVVVYLMLRPTQSLDEKHFADLEKLALIKEMKQRQQCPSCSAEVQDDYIVCPKCYHRLKQVCIKCDALLNLAWEVCPYCAAKQSHRVEGKKKDE
jgi:RNA polymerase subunit RPABC4/transcription elongation factor Spt4